MLNNGDSSQDVFDKILHGNDNDSTIKHIVDRFYKDGLIKYEAFLDESIYCNERTEFTPTSNWVNEGGVINVSFQPQSNNGLENENGNNIKCRDDRDKFSIANSKAKLEYSIALPSMNEMLLLTGKLSNSETGLVRSNPNVSGYSSEGYYSVGHYWTLSPTFSYDSSVYNWAVQRGGQLYPMHNSDQFGVRPVVSLKKNVKYSTGVGSREDPYIVDLNYKISIELVNETEDISVEIQNLEEVEFDSPVIFKVTPIRGYEVENITIIDSDNNEVAFSKTNNTNEYIFTMPTSDVTIIPSYKKVSKSVTIEDGYEEQIIIEVNDSTAVLFEDRVVIKVDQKEGYTFTGLKIVDENGIEINYQSTGNDGEYEFTMPDSNVTVKPLYEIISIPDTEKNKDYTLYFIVAGIALLLSVSYIIFSKRKR